MNATVQDQASIEALDQRPPSWWHRDHPTFTALSGFFAGLAYLVLVPAAYVGMLHVVVDDETTNDLFPLVLLSLVVPIGLLASHRTRRFGRYMLGGMLVTAVVVGGVVALVLWVMVQRDQ